MALTALNKLAYKALITGIRSSLIPSNQAEIKIAEWKKKHNVTDAELHQEGLPATVAEIKQSATYPPPASTVTPSPGGGTTATPGGGTTATPGGGTAATPGAKKKISTITWVLIGVGSLVLIGGLTYLIIKITD